MTPNQNERFRTARGDVHVEQLGPEMLLYDLGSDQVHHLAAPAAAVWSACASPATLAEIASATGLSAPEAKGALDELHAAGLVCSDTDPAGQLTRRRFAKLAAAGAAAAAGVALVTTVAAPTPAAADSAVPPTDPPSCGPNETVVGGICDCLPGYVRDEFGMCVIDGGGGLECGLNETVVDGMCVCLPGYVRNEFGICVRA